MTEGKKYELQEDHTHTLFSVKYEGKEEKKVKMISKKNKIV